MIVKNIHDIRKIPFFAQILTKWGPFWVPRYGSKWPKMAQNSPKISKNGHFFHKTYLVQNMNYLFYYNQLSYCSSVCCVFNELQVKLLHIKTTVFIIIATIIVLPMIWITSLSLALKVLIV